MDPSEVVLVLPCSEEEWSAESSEEWRRCRASGCTPRTPAFLDAFDRLFKGEGLEQMPYSEYGGYVMISAILSSLFACYRSKLVPGLTVDLRPYDMALNNWQRSWNHDPKSRSSGPSSPFGAMAFNASAIYRVTTIRRVRDYSRQILQMSPLTCRIKGAIQLCDANGAIQEILYMLNDEEFQRTPEMTRALISACISFQIPVKIGMKLVTQTASLFWSFVHVLCNLETGILTSVTCTC